MDSAAFLNAPESCFHGDRVAVQYYHMYHGDNFYYAYYDINGNGMEELLIGFGIEGCIRIVDLYGFDGEQAVELVNEPTLGDRSTLTLLTDGTLYLFGASSATETSHTYLKVEGCAMAEAGASTAGEDTNIPWQAFALPAETVSGSSFDSILMDIQAVLAIPTEDYDANMEYYDFLYTHLGDGAVWMLLHRESGVYTLGVWNGSLDIDGDGQEELCVGRGVSPSSVTPILINRQDGEVICGDAVYAYMDQTLNMTWDYLGG